MTDQARRCARLVLEEISKAPFGVAVHPRCSNKQQGFFVTLTHGDGQPNRRLELRSPFVPRSSDVLKALGFETTIQDGSIIKQCEKLNHQLREVRVSVQSTWSENQLTELIDEKEEMFPEPYVDEMEVMVAFQSPEGKKWEEQFYFELDHLLPPEAYNRIMAARPV